MKKIITLAIGLLGLTAMASAQDVKASFPGGEEALTKYITESIKYPASAREMGIEGVVDVQFVVNADGSIGNIKIRRMVDPDLESEAIRIVKTMPAWSPATTGGQAVESSVDISVPFHLD